jgi:hypothetical protein
MLTGRDILTPPVRLLTSQAAEPEVQMGLFRSGRPVANPPAAADLANRIPLAQIDMHKRYDVYCTVPGEERLYENVRFVGIRTFDRITEFSSGFVSGFLEIETADGARLPTRASASS